MELIKHTLWKHVDRYIGLYAFLLSALLAGIVWFLRFRSGNPVLFGPDVYQMLTLVSPFVDNSDEILIRVIILGFSLLCIGISFFFLTSIVTQHIKSAYMVRLIFGLVVITPAFIFGVASFSLSLLVFVCTIAVFYFMDKGWLIPAGTFALLLGMVSPFAVLVVITFVLLYLKWHRSLFFITGFSVIGSGIAFFLRLNSWQGTIDLPNLISDFGSPYGTSIVVIILAILSVLFWDREWSVKSFIMLGTLGLLLLFDSSMLLLFHIAVIVLCARAAEELFTDTWALPTVKKLTVTVVILGILFSTLGYVERASLFSPTKDDHAALASIEAFTPPSVIVFSSPEQEQFILYYAHREAAVGGERDREYYDLVRRAAYVKELAPLLEAKGVSVIYFSSEMTRTLPKEERLRFLLSNERFKMIYSGNTTGVWLFGSGE